MTSVMAPSAFATPQAMELGQSLDSMGFASSSLDSTADLSTKPSPLYSTVTRQSSTRSFESYELRNELGRGAFGVVREALDTLTGHLCCCKSIAKEKLTAEMMQEIRLEADIMHHLKGHPNIVTILDFFEDDSHMHILQELCAGGDLYSKLLDSPVPLPEADACEIMKGVLTVLQHCHSHGVIYRDVKPDNFLLTAKQAGAVLKATDFGISRFLKPGDNLSTYCGTPLYMAPEIFDMSYGFPADVWAAGVVLYWIMCRDFPFTGKNTMELARNVTIKKPVLDGAMWDQVSADVKDLITIMLQKDPSKRPSPADLLKHKWFKTYAAPASPASPNNIPRKKSFSLSNSAKFFVNALREQASGSFGGRWEMNAPLAHVGNTMNIRKLERERNWGEARYCGNQVHWRDAKVWSEVMYEKWNPGLGQLNSSTGSRSSADVAMGRTLPVGNSAGIMSRADSAASPAGLIPPPLNGRAVSGPPALRLTQPTDADFQAALNMAVSPAIVTPSPVVPRSPFPRPAATAAAERPLLRPSRSLQEMYTPEHDNEVDFQATHMSDEAVRRPGRGASDDNATATATAADTPKGGAAGKRGLLKKLSSVFKSSAPSGRS